MYINHRPHVGLCPILLVAKLCNDRKPNRTECYCVSSVLVPATYCMNNVIEDCGEDAPPVYRRLAELQDVQTSFMCVEARDSE